MTEIVRSAGGAWRNEHRSIFLDMDQTALLRDPGGGDAAQWLASRREVLGSFIGEEMEAGHPLTVTGSGWSQSRLYRGDATLLDTAEDQAIAVLPDNAFRDGVGDRRRYVLVAGGAKLERLMAWLAAQEPALSLATAGSHKGQSVAGMLATGSHGSMLDSTGFETHVAGLLFSTGPGEAHWLAREPVLRDEFVAQFAAISDPALFPAALVHLGGMGILSAALLKVEEEFHLGRTRRTRVLPPDWATRCARRDFAGAAGGARTPAFYEVTLDPFRGIAHEALETLWYRNDRQAPSPAPIDGERHVLDLLVDAATREFGVRYESMAPDALGQKSMDLFVDVPKMVWDDFKDDVVDEPDAGFRLADLVASWEPHTIGPFRVDVYNAAFAVPLDRLPEALAIGFGMGAEAWSIQRDYVFTVRFAQASPASMGFLRFGHNAVINIDGLAKGFLWSTAHDRAVELARRFEAAGLPFSMHWGKDAPSDAAKIARDFPEGGPAYRAARAVLLGERARLFVPPMLEQWGLAGP